MTEPEVGHPMPNHDKAAILIVNGGQDPVQGKWLALCVNRILQHTRPGSFQLYIWNNNVTDVFVDPFLQFVPDCRLFPAPEGIALSHVHADPLQRLYEAAKQDGMRFIVTMDSDAHPIRDGWLDTLLEQLCEGAVLAGAWRDELYKAIDPYLHASCLATTVDFIESNKLRLDEIPPNDNGVIHDTLSQFTRRATAIDGKVFAWKRSNQRQFHRLMGGIYGDSVYHHGAGSRATISFWDESKDPEQMLRNGRIGQIATHLLLTDYDNYMAWLSGGNPSPKITKKLDQLAAGHLDIFSKEVPSILPENPHEAAGIPQRALNFAKRPVRAARKRLSSVASRSKKDTSVWPLMVKPFTPSDFSHVEKGWRIGPPDFVGVGMPKAGTSWWYSALLQHPTIYPHRLYRQEEALKTKELHYFTHFTNTPYSDSARRNYQQAFAAPPGGICGEWSVTYLLHPGSLKRLHDTAPQAKILVMLRNPIDRYMSHVNHLIQNRGRRFGVTGDEAKLFASHSVVPEAYLHTLYGLGLSRLLSLFPRERILVLQYERCVQDPDGEMAKTFQFLDVDSQFIPPGLQRKVNKQGYVIDKPDQELRRQLAGIFQTEVETTLALFPNEIDSGLWIDFA